MLERTMYKITSRKKVGIADHNRNELRDIIRTALKLKDGVYVITDRAKNRIYVDTINGITATLVLVIDENGGRHIDHKWFENGATSKKDNGYVYTNIVIYGLHGELTDWICGTHTIVKILEDTDGYDYIDEQGKTPIANHINNRPWDNRGSNLEWVYTGQNLRHGKIVASMWRHLGEDYVHIEHNLSETDFMVLNNPLSIKDIEKYCEEIGNRNEFKCGNTDYINPDVLLAFIKWLEDNKIWVN